MFYVVDWLPTIMHLATGGTWSSGYTGIEIDGMDVWNALMTMNADLARTEIVYYVDKLSYVLQHGSYKYFYNQKDQIYD